jgi:hypothetical protein
MIRPMKPPTGRAQVYEARRTIDMDEERGLDMSGWSDVALIVGLGLIWAMMIAVIAAAFIELRREGEWHG